MAGRNTTIAQAVTDALNAAASTADQFTASFVAERRWLPITDLEQIQGLTVVVFSAGDDRERDNRAYDRYEPVVDVGLLNRLSQAAGLKTPQQRAQLNAEVDAFVELVERVCAFFKPKVIAAANTGAEFKKATILSPLVDTNALLTNRVMTGIVSVTFQKFEKNP